MPNSYHGVAIDYTQNNPPDLDRGFGSTASYCNQWFNPWNSIEKYDKLVFSGGRAMVQGTVKQCGDTNTAPNYLAKQQAFWGGAYFDVGNNGTMDWVLLYFQSFAFATSYNTHWITRINATTWVLYIDAVQMAPVGWDGSYALQAEVGLLIKNTSGTNMQGYTNYLNTRVKDINGNWYDWNWPTSGNQTGLAVSCWYTPDFATLKWNWSGPC